MFTTLHDLLIKNIYVMNQALIQRFKVKIQISYYNSSVTLVDVKKISKMKFTF